ncbi:MAG: biopolymer transporter ExbD [Ichthyobacteriaceae bacterium]|nr:biopolymer transporter ExbD [Ichthyobacteriaceae bacterium]
MSKFKKKKSGGQPAINTSALPDIVFMLLFFFMTTTTMREQDLVVSVRQPKATEVKKLERKSLVSNIYIGKPMRKYQSKFGTEGTIQLNDFFASKEDIKDFIFAEREARKEEEIPLLTTNLKADIEVKMGIITDIKQELRKVQALKLNYSTVEVEEIDY